MSLRYVAPSIRFGVVAASLLSFRFYCEAPSAIPHAKKSPVGEKFEDLDIRLFQYHICPFCNRVKSFLDYHGIPYSVIDVEPLKKGELSFSAEYKKVPVAMIGGKQVNDSGNILNALVDLMEERKVMEPAEIARRFRSEEVDRWVKWSHDSLAVLLFPNITRSFSESLQAFSYISEVPHFTMMQKISNKYVGAVAMRLAQGKIKAKYGIEDERQALYSALKEWTDAVGSSPFLLGDEPCMADLSVFGVIRAIAGLDAHKDLLENSGIGDWYRRMEAAVGESSCTLRE